MLKKVLRVTIVMLLFAAPFVQTTRADGPAPPPPERDAGGGAVALGVFLAAAAGVEALRRRRNAGRA